MPTTVDKADLFECRFYSSEFALLQEKLNLLQQQEQNIRITEALIAERRIVLMKQLPQIEQKLSELGEMLQQKYNVENQDQINWATGEIHPAEAAIGSRDPCFTAGQHAPRASSASVLGGCGTEVADPAGAETPNPRGTEDSGSTVE